MKMKGRNRAEVLRTIQRLNAEIEKARNGLRVAEKREEEEAEVEVAKAVAMVGSPSD